MVSRFDEAGRQYCQQYRQPAAASLAALLFPAGLAAVVVRHCQTGSEAFCRCLYAHYRQFERGIGRIFARAASGDADYGFGLRLGVGAGRAGFGVCHRYACRHFGFCSLFGRVYRTAAGNRRRLAPVRFVERHPIGLGGFCRRTVSRKFFHYAENRGRPYRAVAVLGYLFADGVRAADGLCRNVGRIAFGRRNLGLASRGRAEIFCRQFLPGQVGGSETYLKRNTTLPGFK